MSKIGILEQWQFTHNTDSVQTRRTGTIIASNTGVTINRTCCHIYLGDQLTHLTVDGKTLSFAYDAAGVPMSLTYDGVTYYYINNLQGDKVSILSNSGAEVDRYVYDDWGKHISTEGEKDDSLGSLRYRGYVYDTKTELYYLKRRYYNSELGRFLNADAYANAGQGVRGDNMFAYCGNDPVYDKGVTGTK